MGSRSQTSKRRALASHLKKSIDVLEDKARDVKRYADALEYAILSYARLYFRAHASFCTGTCTRQCTTRPARNVHSMRSFDHLPESLPSYP